MNELQPAPRQLPQPLDPWGASATPMDPTIIDIQASGFKREYAGLLEYWQMIRRHKAAVAIAMVLGLTGGFLLTLTEPRIYQARTTLEIQGLNEEFLNMKNVSAVQETSSVDSDIQTQVRILQSRVLADSVRGKLEARTPPADLQPADRLGVWRKTLKISPPDPDRLWKQALNTASRDLKVRAAGTTRIVEVSCDSTNAALAADYCNTLTQEYIDQNLESRWKTTEYTGTWLTKQLQDLKIKIEKQEEELQSYARATGLTFTSDTNDQEAKLADVQKELFSAQADRIGKQSKYEMASTSPASALPDVLDDPSLKASQQSLSTLQQQLAQLRITFTEGHAEVRKVQAQMASLEASLESARTNVLTRIRKEYEGAERREALLESAYRAQAALVGGKAEQTAHYNLLKRDVDASRLLYETLQQRLKEASIASALRANNIRVVDKAIAPAVPYKPNVRQMATAGLLFGAVLGIGFVVIRERADRTLQDPGDASYYLGLPELGVVPVGELMGAKATKKRARAMSLQLKGAGSVDERVEMVSWRQKNSMLAESFRTTLTSILFSRRSGDRPRILVLTSSSPQEGKTTVVSNLGISLAEINHSVLLIDGDMRRPRLHSLFGVENDLGLSDLLMDKNQLNPERLESACVATSVPGLFVMPSGSSRRNASSLLHSSRLPELLHLAREKFDTVVVDTPPMLNIADARLLARFSDALVLVVRSGVTTRDAALMAKGQFAEDGISILGTVLNYWNPKTPGYSYYGYYYDKHKYFNNDGADDDGGDGSGGSDVVPSGARSKAAWKRGFGAGEIPASGSARESES